MKKILSLILTNENLIDSIQTCANKKHDYGCDHLTVLTTLENEAWVKTSSSVDEVITIDTGKIRSIFSNTLYPNAFAINTFFESIGRIQSQKWDYIVNVDNTNISNLLMGAIESENKVGTYIDGGFKQVDSDWSRLMSIKSNIDDEFFNSSYFNKRRFESTFNVNAFKVDEVKSNLTQTNLTRIKKQLSKDPNSKVIGFYLDDSMTNSFQYIGDVINSLYDEYNFIPVTVTNKDNTCTTLVDQLNKHVNHDIISIECTSRALSSVLLNLDAVISPSNSTISLANYLEVPTVEMYNSTSYPHKTRTRSEGNFIICSDSSCYTEVMVSINQLFSTEMKVGPMNPNSMIFYVTENIGANHLKLVFGPNNIDKDISARVDLFIVDKLFSTNTKTIFPIDSLEGSSLDKYLHVASSRRHELTSYVKQVLNCLRNLKSATNSKDRAMNFFMELDKLVNFNTDDRILATLTYFFEDRVSNIESPVFSERLRLLEIELFKLKDKIQAFKEVLEFKPRRMAEAVPTQEARHESVK